MSAGAYPKVSNSTLYQYKTSYKRAEPLYNKKMKDIKKDDLQAIMDTINNSSATTQQRQKSLFRRVFDYCLANDLVDRNYAEFVDTDIKEKKVIFTLITQRKKLENYFFKIICHKTNIFNSY